ncbi:MAG: DUF4190 domain-containing protein [Pontimonas sp.]
MPTPAEPRDEGPGLVEPEQPAPTLDLDSLDTGRILRDTGSLNIPELNNEDSGDSAEDSGSEDEGSEDLIAKSRGVRSGLNILSVISLILALSLSPFAMMFGYAAVGQSRRAHQRGESLAWVAVGLGWLWTVGWVVLGISLGMTWLQL